MAITCCSQEFADRKGSFHEIASFPGILNIAALSRPRVMHVVHPSISVVCEVAAVPACCVYYAVTRDSYSGRYLNISPSLLLEHAPRILHIIPWLVSASNTQRIFGIACFAKLVCVLSYSGAFSATNPFCAGPNRPGRWFHC